MALRIPHQRNGPFYGHFLACFCSQHPVHSLDGLSCMKNPVIGLVNLFCIFFVNILAVVHAQHFFSGVTKIPQGGFVIKRVVSMQVHFVIGFLHVVEDNPVTFLASLESFTAFLQFIFHPLTVRDIMGHASETDGSVFFIEYRTDPGLEISVVAVLSDQIIFKITDGMACLIDVLENLFHPLLRFEADDFLVAHACEFFPGVACF